MRRKRHLSARCTAALLLASAMGALPALACEPGPQRNPFTEQIDTAHTYDPDGRPEQSAFDTNFDGTIDLVYTYDGNRLASIETDFDYDGAMNLRMRFDELSDEESRLQFDVHRDDDGTYRFVPAWFPAFMPQAYVGHTATAFPRFEYNMGGFWADTFTFEHRRESIAPACGTYTVVTEIECRNGELVRVTQPADPNRYHGFVETRYHEGQPVSSIAGWSPNEITSRTTYPREEGVEQMIETDTDADGEFDSRQTYHTGPGGSRMEIEQKLEDGRWVDVPSESGQWVYADGRLSGWRDAGSEQLRYRYEYDAHGRFAMAYYADADGQYQSRRDASGRTEVFEDGGWTGDYQQHLQAPYGQYDNYFRDGRIAWQELTELDNEGRPVGKMFRVYRDMGQPMPGTVGLPNTWNFMLDVTPPDHTLIARQVRDTDGDGEPDLYIDYETLTITERRPIGWAD